MRQHRVAADNGISTGLSTTVNYVRRTASGAAGNGLGATSNYLRRTRNSAAGSDLGTAIKYIYKATPAGNRLAATIKNLHGAAGIGQGTKIKYRTK